MYLWTTAAVSRHSSHMVRDFLPSEHSTAVAPSLFSSHPCHPTAYFQRNSQSLPCENITQILSCFKFLKMLPSHSLWAEAQVPTLKFKVLPDSLPLTSLNSLLGTLLLSQLFPSILVSSLRLHDITAPYDFATHPLPSGNNAFLLDKGMWLSYLFFMCVCVCVCAQWLSCNPMDCRPPGSSVHGILQARILEWVAISSSRGFSQHMDRTSVSCISCTGV